MSRGVCETWVGETWVGETWAGRNTGLPEMGLPDTGWRDVIFGGVLIWVLGLALICGIPVLGISQVGAYPNGSTIAIVKHPVVSSMALAERIFVIDFPIYIYCPSSSPQLRNFHIGQLLGNEKPFCIYDSWADSGSGFKALKFTGKIGFKGVFLKDNSPPMHNLECWCLARILDVHNGYWPQVGMGNSSLRWGVRPRGSQWSGDINDVAKFRQNVSSKLALSRSSCGYSLANQNGNANPSPDDPDYRPLHVSPVEAIQRSCVGLFFFGLSMWCFYGIAVSAVVAGRYWRAGGVLTGGIVCAFLAVEFFNAAASGIIGWRGIGNSFLCAYAEIHCGEKYGNNPLHSDKIVPRKHLTSNSYWGTVIDMANVLNSDKQIAVIGALTEGSSIRSIERVTGVHRDTIMRLGVKVGQGSARILDSSMRNLPCNRLEMDEIWGFVGKKDRNVRIGEEGVGSVWTFCAIDAETKLVPAFKVGNRDTATAKAFVQDVADGIQQEARELRGGGSNG